MGSGAGEVNDFKVNIVQTDGVTSSGFWKGNIRFEPRFNSEDSRPSGEVFTLEAIVFKEIKTEKP